MYRRRKLQQEQWKNKEEPIESELNVRWMGIDKKDEKLYGGEGIHSVSSL